MGILTKVFVLLVTILAIVLVSLIIPFVHNAFYYRGEMNKAKAESKVSTLEANMAERARENAEQKYHTEMAAYIMLVDQRESQIRELKNSVSDLEQRLIQSENELTESKATHQALAASNDKLSKINELMVKELDAARKAKLELELNTIDQSTRINELELQLARQHRELRALQGQLSDSYTTIDGLKEEIADIRSDKKTVQDLNIPGLDSETYIPIGLNIKGSVLKVQKLEEITLIEINIGSNDKVKENMEFVVHQGTTFVATMKIIKVDQNVSVGQVILSTTEVEQGMRVFTGE